MSHTFAPLDALLFDMDGTLTDSRAASERCWRRWSEKMHVDAQRVLSVCHGRQARETMQLIAPHVDIDAEVQWLLEQELQDTGVVAIAGAKEFLQRLPQAAWALVTSADEALARYRLKLCDLPTPACVVAAGDVDKGKPAPDGFKLGAKRLGAAPERCLVFEDTAVGIKAGQAAGMQTLGIDASGAGAPKGAEHSISDYASLTFVPGPPMQVRLR
jgi:sugar-phosphatase